VEGGCLEMDITFFIQIFFLTTGPLPLLYILNLTPAMRHVFNHVQFPLDRTRFTLTAIARHITLKMVTTTKFETMVKLLT
jgi:hypothetical protein